LNSTAIRGFRKLCFSTLIAVYFLILVGGIVRSTGSGMGCPDWPKCFGRWTPPTSAGQLPENYKEVNSAFREKKNQKFIKYLQILGLHTTAEKMRHDKSILAEDDFNVVKAWIEYVNRLVGVAIGLFITALFWKSIRLRKDYPSIFFYSFAVLIAVILQGWFGSIVVSTNLTTWTVTVHMLLALLIVGLLVYLLRLSEGSRNYGAPAGMKWVLIACIVTLLIQIFLGTQVRESIDRVAALKAVRESWIPELGLSFIIHRSFSLLVLLLHVILVVKLKKTRENNPLSLGLIVLLLGTFLTGLGMAWWSVPAVLQPVHLVLATGALGIQWLLLFRLQGHQQTVVIN
jgi:cytochrome c oxidase assembly protein subunit 15